LRKFTRSGIEDFAHVTFSESRLISLMKDILSFYKIYIIKPEIIKSVILYPFLQD